MFHRSVFFAWVLGLLISLGVSSSSSALDLKVKDLSVKGQRYEAEVPDTLDLAARAELALKPLLLWAEDMKLYPEGSASPLCPNRGVLGPKYLEALPMIRVMSGTEVDLAREKKAIEGYIQETGDDGLFYTPALPPMPEPWASVYGQGRMMLAWQAYDQYTKDPVYRELLTKMANGMKKIAVTKGDYAYYPTEMIENAYFVFSIRKSGWENKDEPEAIHLVRPDQKLNMADRDGHQFDSRMGIPCYIGGAIRAMPRYAAASGDKESLELTRKIVNYVTKPDMWQAFELPPGIAKTNPKVRFSGHIHAHTIALRSILDYAIAAKDPKLKEFAREGYEYVRNFGIFPIGWIPEWTNNNMCEGCEVADMVALGVRLSEAGIGDYWEDVDHVLRNQLVEIQHTTGKPEDNIVGKWAAATDVTTMGPKDGSSCCTPNCLQAIYCAWDAIVQPKNNSGSLVRINLLLNRASPWMDVASYLPYEGKVVLTNKTAKAAQVRIPTGTDRKAVVCRVGDKPVTPKWSGQYVELTNLKPGTKVTIEFPMKESTAKYQLGGEYTVTFRGNTVVDITPSKDGPNAVKLYQREAMRKGPAPMVKKSQFVSDVIIDW